MKVLVRDQLVASCDHSRFDHVAYLDADAARWVYYCGACRSRCSHSPATESYMAARGPM